MPDKRCSTCKIYSNKKNQKNIDTIISVQNNIQYVFFLISEISSYLTAWEIYSIYQTCKEHRDILSDNKIWLYILQRDFNIINPISSYDFLSPIKFAISLDLEIICNHCYTVYNKKCSKHCKMRYKTVSKTSCLEYYHLTPPELLQFQHEVKYNNFFRKDITLFNSKEIRSFVNHKYKGITNFK